MAIAEDASQPAVVTNAAAVNLTTASFSPPSGSLLVALATVGAAQAGTCTDTITDSGGHTWTVGATATGATPNFGVAVMAYTFLSSAPGSITVTATQAGTLASGVSLIVRVLTGAKSSQAGAATATRVVPGGATSTVGTLSITTTTAGSVVYAITDGSANTSAYTLNGATSLINDFVSGSTSRMVQWKATSATGTPGATTLGGTWTTANAMNIAAFEVLPAAAAAAFLDYRHSRGPNYRR